MPGSERGAAIATSLGVLWLPSAPLRSRDAGVRKRAGAAVAISLGSWRLESWLPSAICGISPFPGEGSLVAGKRAGAAVATKSWGLGYHLPLSPFPEKGRWLRGSERERPSPAVLVSWVPSVPFWTRVAGIQQRAGSAVATSLGVLGSWLPSAPFWTGVAGVWKRARAAVATRCGVLALGYHLRICPCQTRAAGVRKRAGAAIANSFGVLVTICPFLDKGRWCPEASGNGGHHQSWAPGHHLRHDDDPPLSAFWTRVAGVRKPAGAAVASSLGVLPHRLGYHLLLSGQGSPVSGSERERPSPPVLGSSLPSARFRTRVACVLKRAGPAVATSLGRLGYHLPLSKQGSLVPGSERERPSPSMK